MVLDLELFRSDKETGDPDKIRSNQEKRFKDVQIVNRVIDNDLIWRQYRHKGDTFNKLKNVCSKAVGEKMKKKEPQGDPNEAVPDEIVNKLEELTIELLTPLTVNQIKKVSFSQISK